MKKTYLAKRNALLSSADISWGAYALLFASFLLAVRLLAPNFFLNASAPLFKISDSFSRASEGLFRGFSDTAALALQNERLLNENAALASENLALVKKVESISGLADMKGIIAGVVARPPFSPYDTLILSGGVNEGITLGMEAFGEGGVPLGVVSSVLAGFSRVTLFSTPGMATGGWVGQKNLPITLLGSGAGALHAFVARSAGISVGDAVFVPGPGMLPVGSVAHAEGDPTSPSITLRIAPSLNLFSVAWVTLRDTGIRSFTFATSTSL